MSRGHSVKALGQSDVQHGAKLQGAVAVDAGIRSSAGFINGYKLVLDLRAKFRLQIHNLKRNPKTFRGKACVVSTFSAGQQQVASAAIVTAALQKCNCHRAVHAAAHSDQYFSAFQGLTSVL